MRGFLADAYTAALYMNAMLCNIMLMYHFQIAVIDQEDIDIKSLLCLICRVFRPTFNRMFLW